MTFTGELMSGRRPHADGGDDATVDRDIDARDEARLVGEEKGRCGGDLVGTPFAADGRELDEQVVRPRASPSWRPMGVSMMPGVTEQIRAPT